MIHTKHRHEGYVVIDNRASPGVSAQFVQQAMLVAASTGHPKPTIGAKGEVGEGKMIEAATITCAHCQRGVILNPQRAHTREWCSYCDHYLCDNCGLIKKIDGKCRNVSQLFDRLQERAARSGPVS